MDIVSKIYDWLYFCIATLFSKLRWGSSFTVEGVFRKRSDTQVIISRKGKLIIGKNVTFQRNVSLTSIMGGILHIGDYVSFNRNCILICHKEITIEENVIFGPGVVVYDHDHKFSDEGVIPGFNQESVFIGRGSWIAANVVILRGTYIGEGCIIGAGTVVKGIIPPHMLVTGVRKNIMVPLQKCAVR